MARFVKGQSGNPAGRHPGTPNRVTSAVREAVLAAFDEVGGKNYLVRLAQDDPKTFCALLARLVPMQLRAELDGTDTVVVIRDYTGRTPKEDADPAKPAPTPLLESRLEPEKGEAHVNTSATRVRVPGRAWPLRTRPRRRRSTTATSRVEAFQASRRRAGSTARWR